MTHRCFRSDSRTASRPNNRRVFYERPWLGGKWSLRSAIDYMLTVDFAILDLATARREHLLRKSWEVARANIEAGTRGGPYAYVVPEAGNALEMLHRLRLGRCGGASGETIVHSR